MRSLVETGVLNVSSPVSLASRGSDNPRLARRASAPSFPQKIERSIDEGLDLYQFSLWRSRGNARRIFAGSPRTRSSVIDKFVAVADE